MTTATRNLKSPIWPARLFSLLLMLATTVTGLPAGMVKVPAGKINLTVEGPEKEATVLAETAQWVEAWLTAMLHEKAPTDRKITVRIGPDLPQPSEPLTLHLSPDITTWNALQELAQRLITRRALALQENPDQPLGSLDWLAAAAIYRTLNLNYNPDLIRANPSLVVAMLSKAHPFPVKTLLENPLPTTFEVPFLLYARNCHRLCAVIELTGNTREARLQRVLELQAAGRMPLVAVELTVGDDYRTGDNLQIWFERKLGNLNWMDQGRHSADEITRRLKEIETLPVVKPGTSGEFGCTQVPMDEISRETRNYQLDKAGLANRIEDFNLLFKQAPPLLQSAIGMYLAAMKSLGEGRNRRFQKQFKDAREAFAAARERQQKVSDFLDSLERQQMQWPRSLEPFLTALEENRQRRHNLAPALQDYLDSLE